MRDAWASSLEELEQLNVMNVTLESGARVSAGTTTLDELMAAEAFPDDLIYIAVLEAAGATVPEMARELKDGGDDGAKRVREMSRDLLRMRDRLCALSLRKGGCSDEEAEQVLERLDGYDRAMLADIAQRRINVDAAGRRFGAETLGQFRGSDPELAGDEAREARGGEGLDVPAVLEG